VRDTSQHPLTRTSEAKGTSKSMILVPLFDLKFLDEFAAGSVGTSNRRHLACDGTAAGARMAAGQVEVDLQWAAAALSHGQPADAERVVRNVLIAVPQHPRA